MEKPKQIILRLTLTNPNGKLVNGQIIIARGVAVATFSDRYLARKLHDLDIKAGKKNIDWNEKNNAYIQKFPYLSIEEITKKLTKEIKKAGGKLEGEK